MGAARTTTEGVIERTAYSNWGTAPDLVAFGGDGADRDGDGQPDSPLAQSFGSGHPADEDYHFIAGTSAAAASAAGCLALMLAAGDTPEKALDHILASAIDLEDMGFDTATGFGALNPEGAVMLAHEGAPKLLPSYATDVKLSISYAGPKKVRLKADITVWKQGGAPATDVRVYGHFLGAFKGASGDDKTNGQGKCKLQTGWMDVGSLPPAWWIPGIGYGFALDRVAAGGQAYDPLAVAPTDDFSGANVIIDQPIRDQ
ncbi:MAG: S8 family serine peptidase [Acidobacteriota bacterium]